LEKDNLTIHFTWVKAHDIYGNELADQLEKEATTSAEAETISSKIPKSAVFKELKCVEDPSGNSLWRNAGFCSGICLAPYLHSYCYLLTQEKSICSFN